MSTRVSKMFRRSAVFLGAFVLRSLALAVVCCGLALTPLSGQSTSSQGPQLKPILDYISTAWDTLTRSMTDCRSLVDPKIKAAPVLYLPAGMAAPAGGEKLSGG